MCSSDLNDTTTISLVTKIDLPLIPSTSVSMAANDHVVVVGSSLSPQAVIVQKSNFSFVQSGGFNPPLNVVANTSDQYGYITITFGSTNNNKTAGVYLLNPNGTFIGSNTGGNFMLNVDQAILPGTLQ